METSPPTCLHGNLVLPNSILPGAYLSMTGGRITRLDRERPAGGEGQAIEAGDGFIVPGFVDIHVHGGGGADYMDGTTEAVRMANRAHLRHGTTTIFPTTTTGSTAQLERMIHSCIEVRDGWSPIDGPHVGGIHFYGPYFAEEKVGCHRPEGRRNPDPEEYRHFFSMGIIRVATCAAELPGATSFYRAAREHGCLIKCGHSNASWTEMQSAFGALGWRVSLRPNVSATRTR